MPLVKVRYKSQHEALTDELIEALGPALCAAVAQHFDCPGGGELDESEVEVSFQEASKFDVSEFDVIVDLEAMHFPLRDKGDEATGQPNFDARAKALGDDIRQMLPMSVSFGLWAKLNNASWYEAECGYADADSYMHAPGDPGDPVPDHGFATPTVASDGDPDAWDPQTGKRPSDPINWGWVGPR